MSDNSDIKKIARFLEIGGTMLAEHCGDCGAPMFRYHGNVICPLCSESSDAPVSKSLLDESVKRPVASKTYSPAVRSHYHPEVRGENRPDCISRTPPKIKGSEYVREKVGRKESKAEGSEPVYGMYFSVEEERLRELIIAKMIKIAEENLDETDPRRIKEFLKLIDRGMELVSKISHNESE